MFESDGAVNYCVPRSLPSRARCQVTRILIHVRDTERVMPRQMLTGRSQLPTQDRHRKALVLCENLLSYVYDWVQFGTVNELRRLEGGNCSSTGSTQVRLWEDNVVRFSHSWMKDFSEGGVWGDFEAHGLGELSCQSTWFLA